MSNEVTDNNNATVEKQEQVTQGNAVEVNAQIKDNLEVFSWHDVGVTVANGKKILQNSSGYAKPGEMVALMGPSG